MSTKKKMKEKIKMPNLRWAILCKTASVDQQTNNLSIFNVIEEFTVNKSISTSPVTGRLSNFSDKTQINGDFTVVIQLDNCTDIKTAKFDLEINFSSPDGISFAKTELSPVFQEGKNRLRIIVALNAIIIKDPGVYNFIISTRTDEDDSFMERTRIPLEVKIFD